MPHGPPEQLVPLRGRPAFLPPRASQDTAPAELVLEPPVSFVD